MVESDIRWLKHGSVYVGKWKASRKPRLGSVCPRCGQVVRKKYANSTERSRAWRARKKAKG